MEGLVKLLGFTLQAGKKQEMKDKGNSNNLNKQISSHQLKSMQSTTSINDDQHIDGMDEDDEDEDEAAEEEELEE